MTIASQLKKAGVKPQPEKRQGPLWQGPSADGPLGGITFSMLSRFLACRERFRIYAIEGLRPTDTFKTSMEYGNMWHLCEENHAACVRHGLRNHDWEGPLKDYAQGLCKRYPLQQEEVNKWYQICRLQFPLYVDWWAQHPDVKDRTPFLSEQVFDVPYKLPSGRTVRLRGKWDSVDLVGKGKDARVWLMENKTKGDIDEPALKRQLASGFDLQTMLYLTALKVFYERSGRMDEKPSVLSEQTAPIAGVRYNVIRRPLAGGKGTIKQKKGQSEIEFYEELSEKIRGATGPEWGTNLGEHHYFMRWNVEVTPADIQRFRSECLDPILEQLCRWYDMIALKKDQDEVVGQFGYPETHFRFPYGCYNPVAEGGFGDVDAYLETGSTAGLRRVETLFDELQ